MASDVLRHAAAAGVDNAQAVVEQALALAEGKLASHKGFITRKVSERSSRWTPQWLDAMIADRVMSGVLATLGEMYAPDHPWRVELALMQVFRQIRSTDYFGSYSPVPNSRCIQRGNGR